MKKDTAEAIVKALAKGEFSQGCFRWQHVKDSTMRAWCLKNGEVEPCAYCRGRAYLKSTKPKSATKGKRKRWKDDGKRCNQTPCICHQCKRPARRKG